MEINIDQALVNSVASPATEIYGSWVSVNNILATISGDLAIVSIQRIDSNATLSLFVLSSSGLDATLNLGEIRNHNNAVLTANNTNDLRVSGSFWQLGASGSILSGSSSFLGVYLEQIEGGGTLFNNLSFSSTIDWDLQLGTVRNCDRLLRLNSPFSNFTCLCQTKWLEVSSSNPTVEITGTVGSSRLVWRCDQVLNSVGRCLQNTDPNLVLQLVGRFVSENNSVLQTVSPASPWLFGPAAFISRGAAPFSLTASGPVVVNTGGNLTLSLAPDINWTFSNTALVNVNAGNA
jgi:hypothetical protein